MFINVCTSQAARGLLVCKEESTDQRARVGYQHLQKKTVIAPCPRLYDRVNAIVIAAMPNRKCSVYASSYRPSRRCWVGRHPSPPSSCRPSLSSPEKLNALTSSHDG